MPRIYTSANDPLDFCWKHFPKTEAVALKKYGNVGDGPDGRGNCFCYDADHPDYEGESYQCVVCNKQLGVDDNGPYEESR